MPSIKPSKQLGAYGEQLAADHLVLNKYLIVDRNWRCKRGEIDIVASQADILVFVEVRTRHSGNTEAAFESVGRKKQNTMVDLAHIYLDSKGLHDQIWRIDVIAIAISESREPIIEHIEDALAW